MKSTIEQLSASERKALAHFYNTAAYKALKHLCELGIIGLGKDALGSQSHDDTRWYGGQANMAAKIPKAVRSIYEESEKNEKATNNQNG